MVNTMGMFSEVNQSKPVGAKGKKLSDVDEKAVELDYIKLSPFMVPCPQSDTENNIASRLAYRLWNGFGGQVTYVDVHRRKKDSDGETPVSALPVNAEKFTKDYEYWYTKSTETGLRPQFKSVTNISGTESERKANNWRVADAIIQRNTLTSELVPVDDWEIVNDDYVASKDCRFEWTNVKAKTGSVMSIGTGGTLKVTILGKRGKVRIDTCNGVSVCEFMALNEQGLINQTIIQQVQLSSSALETCYITYTINYKQVRELKDTGSADVDLWGKLKFGESIAVKQKGDLGRPSLEFKSTVFHKCERTNVNLDDVTLGHKPMLVSVKRVNGKMTVSDIDCTLG